MRRRKRFRRRCGDGCGSAAPAALPCAASRASGTLGAISAAWRGLGGLAVAPAPELGCLGLGQGLGQRGHPRVPAQVLVPAPQQWVHPPWGPSPPPHGPRSDLRGKMGGLGSSIHQEHKSCWRNEAVTVGLAGVGLWGAGVKKTGVCASSQ